MNIKEVLAELDQLFEEHQVDKVEEFLQGKLLLAKNEKDTSSMITIVNELIGFYRDMSMYDKALIYCEQIVTLMKQCGYEDTVPFATTLLNVANAKRAAGLWDESDQDYQEVIRIYEKNIDSNDYRYASLFNNWSLLYQEQEKFELAKESLLKALHIITQYNNTQIEIATTHTNLATTLLRLGEIKDAIDHLILALSIFEEDDGKDYHYSAALSAMGDAKYLQSDYLAASDYYKKAMEELELHVGRTEAYERIADNLKIVQAKLMEEGDDFDHTSLDVELKDEFEDDYDHHFEEGIDEEAYEEEVYEEAYDEVPLSEHSLELEKKGLELSEEFYEEFGKQMIHEKFPEYEDRIAVGLVGEGSDCYGYDDLLSTDHDYGIGFCMWVTKQTYQEIGEALQKAYEELIKEHGYSERKATPEGENRRGVIVIEDFYYRLIGLKAAPKSDFDWYSIPKGAIAVATNGKVFRDDEGIFTEIRTKVLEQYPERVRIYRMSEVIANISQCGQYNYARMMIRKDYVTARIYLAQFMSYTMEMVYLLNRIHEPYKKWQRRGIKDLPILPEIGDILDAMVDMPDQREAWDRLGSSYDPSAINTNDQIQLTIEIIAKLILEEMKLQGLAKGNDNYLDHHRTELLKIVEDPKEIERVRGISRKRVHAFYPKEDMADKPKEAEEIEIPVLEEIQYQNFISYSPIVPRELFEETTKEVTVELKKDPFLSFQSKPLELEFEPNQEEERLSLVEEIVRLEWKQFDEVQNEGGRADCQDDWGTFSIMRKSQYLSWTVEVLKSFYKDLVEAEKAGWNLITEKYARMMESTAPEKYEELKKTLPPMSEDKKNVSEQIIKIQVGWMEEFAAKYPYMAGNARSIHTYEDNPYNTSYETYLRGELGTYSDETLALYGRMIVNYSRMGENLAKMIMTNTAHLYGYQSLEEAEEKLSKNA